MTLRVPPSASPDVQQSFRDLWSAIDRIDGHDNWDLHGRRLVNAGSAVNPGDYLTKGDLQNATAKALPQVTLPTAAVPAAAAPAENVMVGTHAERLITNSVRLTEGTLFLETDRTALYRLASNNWILCGSFVLFDVLANRPSDLGSGDAGFLFLAYDQGVLYRWTGLVWVYNGGILRAGRSAQPLPGNCDTGMIFVATDQGSQAWIKDYASNDWRILAGWGEPMAGTLPIGVSVGGGDAGFLYRATDFDRVYRWTGSVWEDAPGQPTRGMMVFATGSLGTGWHACDGSSVTISTAAGSTTSVTLPNFNAGTFPRANSSAGGTGGASTHTHGITTPVFTSRAESADQVVSSGSGTTVAAAPHVHETLAVSFTSDAASSLPPYQDAILMYRL